MGHSREVGGPESRPWSMGTPGHSLAAVHLHGVPSSCHCALLPGGPPGQHGSSRGTRTPALHTSTSAEASFPQQLFKEVTKQGVSSVGTQAPPTFLRVNKETAKWSPLQGRQHGRPSPSVIFISERRAIPAGPTLPHWPVHFCPHRNWIWPRCLFQPQN